MIPTYFGDTEPRRGLKTIEFYCSNGDIENFERILITYFTEEKHPMPFYIERFKKEISHLEMVILGDQVLPESEWKTSYINIWVVYGKFTDEFSELSLIEFQNYPIDIQIRFTNILP
jgi:hypothetical protein